MESIQQSAPDQAGHTQTDVALRASDATYRTLFQVMGHGFCIVQVIFDAHDTPIDYQFVEVNPAFAHQAGIENVVGRRMRDIAPDHEAHWFAIYGQVAQTGQPVRFEQQAAQLHRWFDVSAFRIGDPTERQVAIVFTDITARKRAEDALAASEAKYRTLFESIDEGFCILEMLFDADGTSVDYRFLQTNAVFEQHTGLAQAVGKTARELVPTLEAHWFEMYGTVARTGAPVRFEQHAAAMQDRWFEVYASRVGGDDSRTVALVFRDITVRKQAEAAILRLNQRNHEILESITDAFFALDHAWRFIYVNQQAERTLHRAHDDLLGKVLWEEYPGLMGSAFEQAYRRAATGGIGGTVTAWYPDHQRWYEAHVYPGAQGITVYFRNVTEQKWAENERERLLAAEHTARVAAEAARAEAEAALHTRDQFLSIASHELRTPLTSLLGYAQVLPQAIARGTGKAEQMSARIVRQAQRLNTLINQLLDVSRLRQGQFVVTQRPLDVAGLVQAVVDEVRATLPATTNHSVELTLAQARVVAVGDAERLEQVLHNLLSNALKYSPAGGTVQVKVTCTVTEASVEITDQGIGMPADAQAHLFEPFYRASNVGGQASGFGLGLYIVREIVARHGGRIEVESTEGVGSTFRVVLPLRATAAPGAP